MTTGLSFLRLYSGFELRFKAWPKGGEERQNSVKGVRLRQKPDLRGSTWLCWRSDKTTRLNQSTDSEQLVAGLKTSEASLRRLQNLEVRPALFWVCEAAAQKIYQTWGKVGDKMSDIEKPLSWLHLPTGHLQPEITSSLDFTKHPCISEKPSLVRAISFLWPFWLSLTRAVKFTVWERVFTAVLTALPFTHVRAVNTHWTFRDIRRSCHATFQLRFLHDSSLKMTYATGCEGKTGPVV